MCTAQGGRAQPESLAPKACTLWAAGCRGLLWQWHDHSFTNHTPCACTSCPQQAPPPDCLQSCLCQNPAGAARSTPFDVFIAEMAGASARAGPQLPSVFPPVRVPHQLLCVLCVICYVLCVMLAGGLPHASKTSTLQSHRPPSVRQEMIFVSWASCRAPPTQRSYGQH